jgi:hypothetical protein
MTTRIITTLVLAVLVAAGLSACATKTTPHHSATGACCH